MSLVYRCSYGPNGAPGCNFEIPTGGSGSHSHPCPRCDGHMVFNIPVAELERFAEKVKMLCSDKVLSRGGSLDDYYAFLRGRLT